MMAMRNAARLPHSIFAALAASAPVELAAQEISSPREQAASAIAMEEDRTAGDPPLVLGAAYTAEVWHNRGGANRGWRYLDNLDLTAELDLEATAGLRGARAFAYALYNNGEAPTDLTGDVQAVSNIETGVRALRLYEAWIEHDLSSRASIRAGLYDVNSEFDALESSSLLIGSAFGIGTDIAQSGEAGPSIFPLASLGLRVDFDAGTNLTLRFALLDGVPGDPDRPKRTAIKLGHGDGALLIAEVDYTLGPVRMLTGGWHYSARQERLDEAGEGRSQGAYLRGEVVLAESETHALGVFGRAGMASGSVNPFSSFFSAGFLLTAPDEWQFPPVSRMPAARGRHAKQAGCLLLKRRLS